MPELLPVTLNIHRHNPAFSDLDHDYASLQVTFWTPIWVFSFYLLQDFTQLMRDMKIGQSLESEQYDSIDKVEEDVYQWLSSVSDVVS